MRGLRYWAMDGGSGRGDGVCGGADAVAVSVADGITECVADIITDSVAECIADGVAHPVADCIADAGMRPGPLRGGRGFVRSAFV